MEPLLQVRDLSIAFDTLHGVVGAVRGVSFDIGRGDAVALVGASGSGKTVLNRSLLGLIEPPGMVSGSIRFEGREIVGQTDAALQSVRGAGMAMVFQDSLDGLNPVWTVGSQLIEMLTVRLGMSRAEARREAVQLLRQVDIPRPEERFGDYPHQFSGGMRQRACIAMAIGLRPQILIADEPTTALDATVQAGILALIRRLQDQTGMSLIMVTHDLAVARQVSSRVLVMYQGQIVESGETNEIFTGAKHPYTRALLAAHPGRARSWRDLEPIPESFATG
jgi:oligopeptide transport system ATP-binding protein